MPAELVLQPTPDAAALTQTREHLTALRATLAERESALTQLRTQLKIFEDKYFRQVGILYAELDDLEAQIAEREVDLYDSDSARRRAREARQRANETQAAASPHAQDPEDFDPPPSLRSLFRELARRIHPDLVTDPAEQQHLTRLMIRANQAYTRGDTETLQRLLDDYRETTAISKAEGPAAELQRLTRQRAHAQRDLAALDHEQTTLLTSEIAQLQQDAEAATSESRDLLAELATNLRAQIADAQYRLNFLNLQIKNSR